VLPRLDGESCRVQQLLQLADRVEPDTKPAHRRQQQEGLSPDAEHQASAGPKDPANLAQRGGRVWPEVDRVHREQPVDRSTLEGHCRDVGQVQVDAITPARAPLFDHDG
jgi:hypothetical protein